MAGDDIHSTEAKMFSSPLINLYRSKTSSTSGGSIGGRIISVCVDRVLCLTFCSFTPSLSTEDSLATKNLTLI